MKQGDDHDSSDEEWETHIGIHRRAFLGLNEPVAEIPLDEGVGIGRTVRNTLARADDIHTRASVSTTSNIADPDEDMPDPGGEEFPVDCDMLDASVVGTGDEDGRNNSPPEMSDTEENAQPEDDSSDSANDNSGDASNDDSEDVEELLNQIPADRIGGNPGMDIAATLPYA